MTIEVGEGLWWSERQAEHTGMSHRSVLHATMTALYKDIHNRYAAIK